MTDAEMDARHERRERLVRRACELMGWPYRTSPVWAGLRKVATAEAVAVGLDRLEEVIARLERGAAGPARQGRPVDDLVNDIIDELHENVQFYDEAGDHANREFLERLRPHVEHATRRWVARLLAGEDT